MKGIIQFTILALLSILTLTGCKKSYTIIVKSNNDNWGSVTGSGTYTNGETITIVAVPAQGYYFICWNDGDETNPRQIVVSGDAEYIATFSDTPGGAGDDDDNFTPEIIHNAVTDIDGNQYDAVKIGDQVWMAQNLRTTHYADGTSIPAGGSNLSVTSPYYYDYSSSGISLTSRGYLYNWPAVMHGSSSSSANPSGVQGICPTGWHVPSDAEWTQLSDYVHSQSQYGFVYGVAKELAATSGWDSCVTHYTPGYNQNSNNATGFSAVPAGLSGRDPQVGIEILSWNYDSFYLGAGEYAGIWSSTQYSGEDYAYLFGLYFNYSDILIWQHDRMGSGHSVRCLKD